MKTADNRNLMFFQRIAGRYNREGRYWFEGSSLIFLENRLWHLPEKAGKQDITIQIQALFARWYSCGLKDRLEKNKHGIFKRTGQAAGYFVRQSEQPAGKSSARRKPIFPVSAHMRHQFFNPYSEADRIAANQILSRYSHVFHLEKREIEELSSRFAEDLTFFQEKSDQGKSDQEKQGSEFQLEWAVKQLEWNLLHRKSNCAEVEAESGSLAELKRVISEEWTELSNQVWDTEKQQKSYGLVHDILSRYSKLFHMEKNEIEELSSRFAEDVAFFQKKPDQVNQSQERHDFEFQLEWAMKQLEQNLLQRKSDHSKMEADRGSLAELKRAISEEWKELFDHVWTGEKQQKSYELVKDILIRYSHLFHLDKNKIEELSTRFTDNLACFSEKSDHESWSEERQSNQLQLEWAVEQLEWNLLYHKNDYLESDAERGSLEELKQVLSAEFEQVSNQIGETVEQQKSYEWVNHVLSRYSNTFHLEKREVEELYSRFTDNLTFLMGKSDQEKQDPEFQIEWALKQLVQNLLHRKNDDAEMVDKQEYLAELKQTISQELREISDQVWEIANRQKSVSLVNDILNRHSNPFHLEQGEVQELSGRFAENLSFFEEKPDQESQSQRQDMQELQIQVEWAMKPLEHNLRHRKRDYEEDEGERERLGELKQAILYELKSASNQIWETEKQQERYNLVNTVLNRYKHAFHLERKEVDELSSMFAENLVFFEKKPDQESRRGNHEWQDPEFQMEWALKQLEQNLLHRTSNYGKSDFERESLAKLKQAISEEFRGVSDQVWESEKQQESCNLVNTVLNRYKHTFHLEKKEVDELSSMFAENLVFFEKKPDQESRRGNQEWQDPEFQMEWALKQLEQNLLHRTSNYGKSDFERASLAKLKQAISEEFRGVSDQVWESEKQQESCNLVNTVLNRYKHAFHLEKKEVDELSSMFAENLVFFEKKPDQESRSGNQEWQDPEFQMEWALKQLEQKLLYRMSDYEKSDFERESFAKLKQAISEEFRGASDQVWETEKQQKSYNLVNTVLSRYKHAFHLEKTEVEQLSQIFAENLVFFQRKPDQGSRSGNQEWQDSGIQTEPAIKQLERNLLQRKSNYTEADEEKRSQLRDDPKLQMEWAIERLEQNLLYHKSDYAVMEVERKSLVELKHVISEELKGISDQVLETAKYQEFKSMSNQVWGMAGQQKSYGLANHVLSRYSHIFHLEKREVEQLSSQFIKNLTSSRGKQIQGNWIQEHQIKENQERQSRVSQMEWADEQLEWTDGQMEWADEQLEWAVEQLEWAILHRNIGLSEVVIRQKSIAELKQAMSAEFNELSLQVRKAIYQQDVAESLKTVSKHYEKTFQKNAAAIQRKKNQIGTKSGRNPGKEFGLKDIIHSEKIWNVGAIRTVRTVMNQRKQRSEEEKETAKETAKEITKEIAKETAKVTAKRIAKETAKVTAKETAKYTAKEKANETAKELQMLLQKMPDAQKTHGGFYETAHQEYRKTQTAEFPDETARKAETTILKKQIFMTKDITLKQDQKICALEEQLQNQVRAIEEIKIKTDKSTAKTEINVKSVTAEVMKEMQKQLHLEKLRRGFR